LKSRASRVQANFYNIEQLLHLKRHTTTAEYDSNMVQIRAYLAKNPGALTLDHGQESLADDMLRLARIQSTARSWHLRYFTEFSSL
jgi:hypothetical protein